MFVKQWKNISFLKPKLYLSVLYTTVPRIKQPNINHYMQKFVLLLHLRP